MWFKTTFLLLAQLAICFAGPGEYFYSWWSRPPKPDDGIRNLTYNVQQSYSSGVYAVVQVEGDVYTIRQGEPSIEVLTANLTRKLLVIYQEFKSPYDMVYDCTTQSLYLLEWTENGTVVYRINVQKRFNIDKLAYFANFSAGSLSTTPDGNLLVVVRENGGKIMEFNCNGRRVRTIEIYAGSEVRHAIKLKSGLYAVAAGSKESDQHVVFTIDARYPNRTMKSFGGSVGSGPTQLNSPWRLLELKNENLLVADMFNKRIVELNKNLTYNRTLVDYDSGNGFNNPQRFLQSTNPRMFYVASNDFDAQLGYPPTGKIIAYKY